MKLSLRIAIVSSLLFVIVLLWVYTSMTQNAHVLEFGSFNFEAYRGTVMLRFFTAGSDDLGAYKMIHGWYFLGFQAYRMTYASASNYSLIIPDWAIVVALAALLWRQVRSWWKARRIRLRVAAGRCEKCNYDLRASADRCPECGTVPSGK